MVRKCVVLHLYYKTANGNKTRKLSFSFPFMLWIRFVLELINREAQQHLRESLEASIHRWHDVHAAS